MSNSLEAEIQVIHCESCTFTTTSEVSLNEHNVNNHSATLQDDESAIKFLCTTCDDSFETEKDLREHIVVHDTLGQITSNSNSALCHECKKNIDDNLLKIQCSKCFDIFHKKCTDRKSSRGNWTSPPFICPRCTSSSPILAVNNYLDPAAAKSYESLSALPRLSGKQKRSTVNDTNPSIEFLNATIDTKKCTCN